MGIHKTWIFFVIVLRITYAGAHPVDKPKTAKWPEFVKDYLEQTFRIHPFFAVYQGRHEFDGQIPDWSPQGLAKEISFLKTSMKTAQAFNEATLSKEENFERSYLLAQARGRLFWLEVADEPHRNPAFYMNNGLDPAVYATRPYASPEVRLKAYLKYLIAIPTALTQIKTNLKTPLPLSFIDYGTSAFGGFASYYVGDGKKAFAAVANPSLQKELDVQSAVAAKAMVDAVKWLEAQRPNATQGFALGVNKFAQMLRDTEMVDTPLKKLEEIGWADLRHNQEALRTACEFFAPEASLAGCMNAMIAKKPQGGAVAGARAQLAGLKAFIQKEDLVTIPGAEEALVDEAPAYNRQNSAYIEIPGPFEKGLPSVYYIAPPDPHWPPEVQAAFAPGKADLLFTSVHEVWPGHFLNFLHANRSKFIFGKVFVGYAFAEGWAHYGEQMMWDAGLGKGDSETHIGQISNALLRDCRFLSAIGLHSGTLTLDQSRLLFAKECYQDEGTARQQSARGTYDPAYLNYTMGKLLIQKLRDDWTKTRGGRQAWKAFHDQFLSYGGPPIPLVRQQMLGGDAKAVF